MIYVGLYQSRLVGRLLCPIFGDGCEGVADAPFARPFGIPDGYVGAVLYIVILALLLAPPGRWIWIALLVLSSAATLANIFGVRDMMNLGGYCFYCLTTAFLSPVLLWSVWDGVGESSRRPRTASADTQMTIDFSNSTTGAVGDRTRIDSDYVFHELTRSICPNCRASVVRNAGRSCRSCNPMPKLTCRIPYTASRARFRWRTAPPSSTAACVYRKPYPS